MPITLPNNVFRARNPLPQPAVTILGLLTCVIVISSCGTTSSPPATSRPPAPTSTTVVSPHSASRSAAAQPSTSAPGPSRQSASNTHPPSGTTFAGEGLTAQQSSDLQQAVDNGHQPWRLDRVQVAKVFAQQRFGWSDSQAETGAPTVVFLTGPDGSRIALHLTQPATRGDQGIWVVDSGVWG
ncbi:acyl transferase [Nocardia sp. NPDC050175]|uniref:acyl transferase n=1 Tax=Nocardia sp. NPDC050175 TaxID=3364317 RepID=UPI0037898717